VLVKISVLAPLPALALIASTPAAAQFAQVNDPAPGYSSLLSSDYAGAEREIRSSDVSRYDPARTINLGIAFAKTGQADKAEREFRQVLREDDVQIVVANGGTYSSHQVAYRALDALKAGALSR
jgi:hypothetical protein